MKFFRMRFFWRKESIILGGFLLCLSVIVNCRALPSQAASTFTAAEIESMANRVMPAVHLAETEPELPRIFLDTSYAPSTKTPKFVAAGDDLQAAINAAQPGDVLTLQAGATFNRNYTLPAKTGSDWITIRTSAPDSSLPPPGTRITPEYANVMPKLVGSSTDSVLTALDGAHHYRFIGVEFTVAPNTQRIFNIILLGANQTSLAQLPHDLIFDRVYIHGRPETITRRGVALNSASTAIIDSYISDCHEEGADSQAISCWNGPGPFKIVNNYLEGAGENLLFGGADPPIANLVPSDIEVRNNHFFKPLSWFASHPSFAGRKWSVKNLFELKSAQRVLVDGNLFENNWVESQNGYAILFTVRNQDGGAPWSVVQDISFTNNIVRHVAAVFNMFDRDENFPSLLSGRFRISNNLFDDVNGPRWGNGAGTFLQNGAAPFVHVDHNTIFQTGNIVFAGRGEATGFIFTNNIAAHNEYGIIGDGRGSGNSTINFYFPGSKIVKNLLWGGASSLYPSDNFFPGTPEAVGFVNYAAGDYRLAASSPYKKAGTDGKDLGCDFNALNAAFNGFPTVASVSAASYSGLTLAPESIAAAFGTGLSTGTSIASEVPLPTTLSGTSVTVRDRTGVDRLSPLFFVSPTQINYQVPAGTAAGTASVTVTNGENLVARGFVSVVFTTPGLFTADGSGRGLPTGLALHYRSSVSQRYDPIVRFDTALTKFVPVPIDVSNSTEQVFLILYGTGIRFRASLPSVTATIGGVSAPVTFAGAQGQLVGVDQININLPRSLNGRGDVDVVLTVDGKVANKVRVQMK